MFGINIKNKDNKSKITIVADILITEDTIIKVDGEVKDISSLVSTEAHKVMTLSEVLGKSNTQVLFNKLRDLYILDGYILLKHLDIRNGKVLSLDVVLDNLDKIYKSLISKTTLKETDIVDENNKPCEIDNSLKQEIVFSLWKCRENGYNIKHIGGIKVTKNTNMFNSSRKYIVEIDVKKTIEKKFKFTIIKVAIFMVVLNLVISLVDFDEKSESSVKLYTEFVEHLEAGEVYMVDLETSGQYFRAYLKDNKGNVSKDAITYYSPNYPEFRKDLALAGVKIKVTQSLKSKLLVFANLSSILIVYIIIGSILKQQFSQLEGLNMLGVDDSYDTNKDKVTFDDIAGIDGIVDDIRSTLDSFMSSDGVYAMGGRISRGILLEGQPGTGKTLLAKAIANTMGANFIGLSGGDFNQIFMGAGARKVNTIFKKAKQMQPCVIFIDEIDAIGAARGGSGMGDREYSNTLNTLLAKMDGISNKSRILLVGATNLASSLDPALLRAGRFDKIYTMNGSNSKDSRRSIIELHLRNKYLQDGVDREQLLDNLTKVFNGLSPATIASILSESVVKSFTDGNNGYLDFECIDKTFTRHMTRGVEDENKGKDVDVVATHESGHILAGLLQGKELLKGTIVGSTSGVGGFALFNEVDYNFKSIDDLNNELQLLLAGLASTEVIYGVKYIGASNDLEKATQLVHNILYDSGLDSKVCGIRSKLMESDMEAIDNYINSAYQSTKILLQDNIQLLKQLIVLLKDKTTVYGLTLKDLQELN